jgi:hypothetical protein
MPSPEDLPAPLAGRKKRHRGKAAARTRSSPTRRKVKTSSSIPKQLKPWMSVIESVKKNKKYANLSPQARAQL